MRLLPVSALTLCLCATAAVQPQQKAGQRLILKDGSFENVLKYEIKGDRVRYLSAERREWEELPEALVDWPATEKHARDAALSAAAGKAQLNDLAAKKRADEEARAPLVAAGLRLPAAGGVFLLDVFENKPGLLPLSQNGADLKKNVGGNILRGIINPVASSRQTIELKGPHASVQSHVRSPAVYVALESQGDPSADYTPETAGDHFRIVRCEEKKGNRVVGVISIAVYGKVKHDARFIPTRVETVSGMWVKVSPAEPVEPGEYALVELLGKEGMNQFVWDFGVNPSAPANAGAVGTEPDRNKPALIVKPGKKPARP